MQNSILRDCFPAKQEGYTHYPQYFWALCRVDRTISLREQFRMKNRQRLKGLVAN